MECVSVSAHGLEPEFSVSPKDVRVPQGRDAIFTCVVKDLGGYRVSANIAPARVTKIMTSFQPPALSTSAPSDIRDLPFRFDPLLCSIELQCHLSVENYIEYAMLALVGRK